MAPTSSPRSKIPMKALDSLVTCGLVRYVGACNMSAWQIMKAQGLARQYSYALETEQCCYTIAGRDLEREIIPMVSDQQMGLMIWSPLASGFSPENSPARGPRSRMTRGAADELATLDQISARPFAAVSTGYLDHLRVRVHFGPERAVGEVPL